MKISKNITSEKNPITRSIGVLVPLINGTLTLQNFSTLIMMAIWFLLPLKYGGNVNPTVTSMWNQDLFSWIYAGWPVFTFPLISAVALLVILLNRRGFSRDSLFFCLLIVFPGIMILIASLIGWINTTEKDVAYLFSAQLLGIIVLVSASVIHIQADPKARRLILISICAGSLAASSITWNQKFYMYPKILKNIEVKLEQGERIDEKVLSRLRSDTDFPGPFSWKNTLGAHLILLLPVCVLLAWRAGRYVDPPRASSFVFSGFVIICTLGALWFSKSLAAALIITIVITSIALFWIIRRFNWGEKTNQKRLKHLFLLLLVTVCLGVFFQNWIVKEKKISTLNSRFSHWEQAINMFEEKPFLGVGMGEYYTHYLQNKSSRAPVTRFAHSLFLCFLSQCGVFGGIAALIMLFYPIWLMILIIKRKLKFQSEAIWVAVFSGSLAWAGHSLLDFNIQVPSTVATFLILPSLGLKFHKDDLIVPLRRFIPVGLIGLLFVGICLIPITRFNGEKNYKILSQLIKNQSSEKNIYTIGEIASRKLPYSPYPASKIAQFAIKSEQYEYAVKQLKDCIRRTPHRSTYYAMLAQVYEKMGRKDDALLSIELALLWYPTNKKYKEIRSFLKDS